MDTVFDVSRSIYEKDFQKINTVYKEKAIPAELGVVIGAITESQKLINHALQSEKKGGQIYMCGALEELVNEGVQRGRQEGRIEASRRESRKESRLILELVKLLKSVNQIRLRML